MKVQNVAHKLTANPGTFQIANVSLQRNTTGITQQPSAKQRHDAYPRHMLAELMAEPVREV